MHRRLWSRRVGIELHGVRFDAHDGARVGGQQHVGNLGQHGVGQVLHHEGQAVGARPAEAQQRAGLGLAGLEGHARPAQFATQPHQAPIVRTFVHKERLAPRDAVHVDAM